jgi:hypothetical protein
VQIKYVPIKSMMVRCKKKGKTVGRPSKVEIFMSWAMNKEFSKKSTMKAIQKMQEDMFLYGTGCVEIKDN